MKFLKNDEKLYGQAIREYEAGIIDSDLKAKAYVLAKGDSSAEKFEYIQLRVNQIRNKNSLSYKMGRGMAAIGSAIVEDLKRKGEEKVRSAEEERRCIAEEEQRRIDKKYAPLLKIKKRGGLKLWP